ncbi:hypothetical protein [Paracoccus sp. pheM1]|uniref:hypothetical protein n=1 Tax=Paracoccus sp. pheM1 TaxID=2831675 RepID=UPI001BDB737E|nr:hypothetical protein [Paracoccus sp. pheM1]MBT0780593.1 hypothetical protein [Paracoccus sp. pheM1]
MSDDLIAEALTEHWGPRCKTKDTDDFPDLAGATQGRCACCLAWEQYDRLRAEVERLTAALADERAHADAMAEALKEIADLPAGNAHAVGTAKRARHIAICARRQG